MIWHPCAGAASPLIVWRPPSASSVQIGKQWMRSRIPGMFVVPACTCDPNEQPKVKRVPVWARSAKGPDEPGFLTELERKTR